MRPSALAVIGVGALALVVALILLWPGTRKTGKDDLINDGQAVQAGDQSGPSDTEPSQAAPPQMIPPSFDVVRISRGGTGVIAGRADPDAQVEVLENGEVVASVRADSRGEWVLLLERPLNPGTAELTLKATAPDGRVRDSEDVVVIDVPADQGDGFVASDRDGVVAIVTDRQGGASRVLQRPGAPGGAIRALGVDTLDYGPDRPAIIGGRAEARSRVRIYLDNAYLGEANADNEGRWQIQSARLIVPGSHVIRLDQVVADGRVEVRVEQPFIAGEPLDLSAAQTGVRVRAGNSLWEISREIFGAGQYFTLIFRENSDQIADPDLIYPNQVFRLPEGDEGG